MEVCDFVYFSEFYKINLLIRCIKKLWILLISWRKKSHISTNDCGKKLGISSNDCGKKPPQMSSKNWGKNNLISQTITQKNINFIKDRTKKHEFSQLQKKKKISTNDRGKELRTSPNGCEKQNLEFSQTSVQKIENFINNCAKNQEFHQTIVQKYHDFYQRLHKKKETWILSVGCRKNFNFDRQSWKRIAIPSNSCGLSRKKLRILLKTMQIWCRDA